MLFEIRRKTSDGAVMDVEAGTALGALVMAARLLGLQYGHARKLYYPVEIPAVLDMGENPTRVVLQDIDELDLDTHDDQVMSDM